MLIRFALGMPIRCCGMAKEYKWTGKMWRHKHSSVITVPAPVKKYGKLKDGMVFDIIARKRR